MSVCECLKESVRLHAHMHNYVCMYVCVRVYVGARACEVGQ